MSNLSEINEIFDRCIQGTATEAERGILYDWMTLPENRTEAVKLWEIAFADSDGSLNMGDRKREAMIEAILSVSKDLPPGATDGWPASDRLSSFLYPSRVHRVHFLKTAWFRYVAALLLVAGTAIYLYRTYQKPSGTVSHQPLQYSDILPGGNKATLTLCDGSKIVLDSAAPGNLTSQGNTKIIKLDEGALAYRAGGATGETLYNTISTPKGGQYRIVLPDGSRVWLNAASSIRFPTRFVKDRKVMVTGEAYMEVVADKNKPFWVEAGNMQIQVLGTSFNVNVYADEPAGKTTLIEGAVKIGDALLKPGLAYINGKIVPTDISQDIAWKNGLFNLNNKSLQEVMRQIARWYDIEIVYEGKMPVLNMGGKMDRGLNLSDILEFLRKMNIKFRMEERTLILTS